MPVKTACAALERGSCFECRYRSEHLVVEVHAVGYGADGTPLLQGWQRVGFSGGGWRIVKLNDARDPEISGYFSEAPRPGYRPSEAIAEVICQV